MKSPLFSAALQPIFFTSTLIKSECILFLFFLLKLLFLLIFTKFAPLKKTRFFHSTFHILILLSHSFSRKKSHPNLILVLMEKITDVLRSFAKGENFYRFLALGLLEENFVSMTTCALFSEIYSLLKFESFS